MARDGRRVADIMGLGKQLLGHRQVMAGVGEVLHSVQVEATFPDGTKLVTIHDPVCQETVDCTMALYDSFLPVPPASKFLPLVIDMWVAVDANGIPESCDSVLSV
ncbi:hypothetical protein SARC_08045 [Sphaeroforma arctica JP610]|uniref:Urease n=1 Tax=Sphaeroforma arctica JP610 TaxID=667725 RepID=A0A0L0FS90_9EUKA|nr:hypothetical protein SARC_08045 [Sphaeroforma arctica JP610]KNC79559.1 hypothetical protein SARC_08045 [Sphaeroforma arctica JP610]|eukprot:XP_014153461.1 hypothetical protein SARC_08045 [Sphaeroforma arctica JP610]